MKLKDMVMDMATRRVLLRARLLASNPSASRLKGLQLAVHEFEELHADEMAMNLLAALDLLEDDNEETLS
jgi:hypothetical protein